MPCPALPDGFDFTDPDVYQSRVPLPEFAQLRRTAPVWWNAQPHGIAGFGDNGYWVVTRHQDVKEVSTKPEVFSANLNTSIIRFNAAMTRDQIDVQKLIMLNMDPPEHTRVRQIVQRGFTPRSIRALEVALRHRAAQIVAEARRNGSRDFVTDVACELPSRPSRNSSASPRTTGRASSTGRTRWSRTTIPNWPSPKRSA